MKKRTTLELKAISSRQNEKGNETFLLYTRLLVSIISIYPFVNNVFCALIFLCKLFACHFDVTA